MPRETLFHHSYPERKLKLLPTHKSLMLNRISCSCACFMCVTLLVLILLHADLVVHDKMFALICILLKFGARTKFEA